MPNVTFGLPVAAYISVPPSQIGNTLQIHATVTTSVLAEAPYTYSFYAVNSVTNTIIANSIQVTNSLSYTQDFTFNSYQLSQFPATVYVTVNDSASHSSTSQYSNIVEFGTIPVVVYSGNDYVDQNGTMAWTVGANTINPYDINATVQNSNGIVVLVQNQTYNYGNSILAIQIPANLVTGNYTLKVNASEWASGSNNYYIASGSNSISFTVSSALFVGNIVNSIVNGNIVLSASVTGGTLPYTYAWFAGNDINCKNDVTTPWNWVINGGSEQLNYTGDTTNSFTVPSNTVQYTCYAVQDPTGAWAISNVYGQLVTPNILYYVPINLSSAGLNWNTALPPNTPLQVNYNALAYQQYELPNLNNTEYFFANGTCINSWLEGNALNLSATNNLHTSTNVISWVDYPWGSTFLGVNSVNTIYLGWAGNTISTANNLFSPTGCSGEAPYLSNSYGAYDNGDIVFNPPNTANTFYTNFAGTSTPSGMMLSGSGFTINNGIEDSPSGSQSYIVTAEGYSNTNANIIIEMLGVWPNQAGSGNSYNNVFGFTDPSFYAYMGPDENYACGGNSDSVYLADDCSSLSSFPASDTIVQITVTANSSIITESYDWSSYSGTTDYPTTITNVGIHYQGNNQNGEGPLYVLRVQRRIPNNVQPTVTLGTVHST